MESKTLTLSELAEVYTSSAKKKDTSEEVQRELIRFVRWCGQDRVVSAMTPPEVEQYGEHLAGTGSTVEITRRLKVVRAFFSYARKQGLIEQNLAQHVRVRRSKIRSTRGQLRETRDPIELTSEGHAGLVAEVEKLRGERGPLALQIRTAAADKDVRENVPLEAAREQLGHVESRIREIEETLKYAVVIDGSPQKGTAAVSLGMLVSVRYVDKNRETSYRVVSASEAKPLEAKISDVSPLGKALMGRLAGEEVEVDSPRGKTRYRILKVSS